MYERTKNSCDHNRYYRVKGLLYFFGKTFDYERKNVLKGKRSERIGVYVVYSYFLQEFCDFLRNGAADSAFSRYFKLFIDIFFVVRAGKKNSRRKD